MSTGCLVAHVRHPALPAICKGRACKGKVYQVWEAEKHDCCWGSQSIPAICAAIIRFMSHPRKLYEAGIYTVVRFEALYGHHKYYRVTRGIVGMRRA